VVGGQQLEAAQRETMTNEILGLAGVRGRDGGGYLPFMSQDQRLAATRREAPTTGIIYDIDGRLREAPMSEIMSTLPPDQISAINAATWRGGRQTLSQVLQDPNSHIYLVDTSARPGTTNPDIQRDQLYAPAPHDIRKMPTKTGDKSDAMGWKFKYRPDNKYEREIYELADKYVGPLDDIENLVDPATGGVANITRDSHIFDRSPRKVGVVHNFAVDLPNGGAASRSVGVGNGGSPLLNMLVGPLLFRSRDRNMLY
jgi:hypothetical protein